MNSEQTELGLRERKKLAMRATISAVALRLAMERGVAQVRIEDIAAEADISPRTFSNYFPNKESAIVGSTFSRVQRFRSALRQHRADLSLQDALSTAILSLFPEEHDHAFIARSHLLRTDPGLQAEERRSDIEVERIMAEEIALRLNVKPGDFYARVLAASLIAVLHTAVTYWLERPDGPSLHDTVLGAMKLLNIESLQAALEISIDDGLESI